MKSMFKLALSAAFGCFLLGAMPVMARAQEDISQKIIPSLELEQADVREALRALFKNVNVSYSIAPEVQGTVTVSLKNVTFDTDRSKTFSSQVGFHDVPRRSWRLRDRQEAGLGRCKQRHGQQHCRPDDQDHSTHQDPVG